MMDDLNLSTQFNIKFDDKINDYIDNLHNIKLEDLIDTDEVQGITTEEIGCVINENGEKFECTLRPSRKQNANFIDGNKFDFYEIYGMTKKDATDKIKVVLLYYGETFTIELEKISNSSNKD